MLKVNSNQARKAVRDYIEATDDEQLENILTFSGIATTIIDLFDDWYNAYEQRRIPNRQDAFVDWSRRLPLDIFDYWYYTVSAVEILGDILEETEEEKTKYNEDDAAVLLTKMIYKEVTKA